MIEVVIHMIELHIEVCHIDMKVDKQLMVWALMMITEIVVLLVIIVGSLLTLIDEVWMWTM